MLSGMADATTATDNSGQFAFTGLRAGSYSVEISGFDMDEVGFGNTSSAATVGVGESKIISFDGTYLRTAGIMGQVSVEGVGLARRDRHHDRRGRRPDRRHRRRWSVRLLEAPGWRPTRSQFPGMTPTRYEFADYLEDRDGRALARLPTIPFEGTLLRTSGISGRVSVEGMGLDGVEVAVDRCRR